MKLLVLAGAMIVAIGMVTAAAAVALELSSETTNEINVTADSSPGWIPTTEQRQRAIKTVEAFLDAVEGGRYPEAYGMQTEDIKRIQTLAQFAEDAQKFRAQAGAVKFWRVLKVTWTKDPARAPSPGIYAAIDLTAQLANVDRVATLFCTSGRLAGILRSFAGRTTTSTTRPLEVSKGNNRKRRSRKYGDSYRVIVPTTFPHAMHNSVGVWRIEELRSSSSGGAHEP